MPDTGLNWGELFARYEPIATAFARGLAGDAELARDLFQEAARATYERAASGAVAFESAAHARNYLFQTMRNLAADALSDRGRAPLELIAEPASASPSPADSFAAREATESRSEAIRAVFATLPQREQEALSLRYLEGQSYRQISDRTGKSISTLQARVEAGLRRLRNRIGNRNHPE